MGSSASVSHRQRREQVTERKRMLKSVERFIINVYATCPRVESMTLLLSSDSGHKAFLEFVKSEHADETLALYTESLNLLRLSKGTPYKRPINGDEFHENFVNIIKRYIVVDSEISQVLLPMPLFDAIMKAVINTSSSDDKNGTITTITTIDSTNATTYATNNATNNDATDNNTINNTTNDTSNTTTSNANNTNDTTSNANNTNTNNTNSTTTTSTNETTTINIIETQQSLLEDIIDECILMMASIQLHRFITSKYFKKWRILEANHAIATTSMEIGEMPSWNSANSNNHSSSSSKENSVSFRSLDRSMRKIIYSSDEGGLDRQNSDLSVRAFKNVRFDELENILSVDSWLAILISAAEALSVSFVLTSVNIINGVPEFPTIYVNRYFEKMTGYPQRSALGKPFLFMTCNDTEQESIQILKNGMIQGQQVSTVLTLATIKKKSFKNLIIVKPIFTKNKKYIYTVSIQMDVTREVDAYVSKQKLVLDLINMLPTNYFIDDEEHDPALYGCINT